MDVNYNKQFPVQLSQAPDFLFFVIQYRWKGENVATTEVAGHLLMLDCVEEANVYGVKVPGNYIIRKPGQFPRPPAEADLQVSLQAGDAQWARRAGLLDSHGLGFLSLRSNTII